MRTRRRLLTAVLAVLVLIGATAPVHTPVSARAPEAGFYSPVQADRGQAVFGEHCALCHETTELSGTDFEYRWRRQTAWNLYRYLSQAMPEDLPGSLEDEVYVDLVAYLLQVNGYPAGDTELSPTRESLGEVRLGPDADKTGETHHDDRPTPVHQSDHRRRPRRGRRRRKPRVTTAAPMLVTALR